MMRSWMSLLLAGFLLVGLLAGCAASRSELRGTFGQPGVENLSADKVSVFFLFRHLTQQHGYDSIPKLRSGGVADFDNLFRDALSEISNVSAYETYTDSPLDIHNPDRREKRRTLQETHDYTLKISFFEESSFKQQCFSGTISLLSLTIIPMPYTWDYTITAELYDRQGNRVKTYQREAELSNWVQGLLIFAYPFYPMEGKREEIYSEALHDILRQIETEKVLRAAPSAAASSSMSIWQ